jgi:hypothetical protein
MPAVFRAAVFDEGDAELGSVPGHDERLALLRVLGSATRRSRQRTLPSRPPPPLTATARSVPTRTNGRAELMIDGAEGQAV